MENDLTFVDACKQVKIQSGNRFKRINPHKALYSLTEASHLLPYQSITLQKMALGILKNTIGINIYSIEGAKGTRKKWVIYRQDLVDFFNNLKSH